METIKLIIGLGNPGKEYVGTRHNIGFDVIDAIAKSQPTCGAIEKACSSEVRTFRFKGETRYLIKPQTYMNLSGEAVYQASMLYNVKASEMLIIYDDLDFDVGTFKIKGASSAGGHNGMQSIISCMKSEKIPRLRMGIGTDDARKKQVNYVLSAFDSTQIELIQSTKEQAVEAVKMILARGISFAMNQFNRKIQVKLTTQDVLEEKQNQVTNNNHPITGGPNIE